jgi:hypothetical protein
MAEAKPAPTNKQIDELAALYIDAKNAVELARSKQSELADQVVALIEQHGFVPRRATKSKRIEGDEYQCTLSKGHSVEVISQRASAFRAWASGVGLIALFRKLFKRETVWVMREDADTLVAGRAAAIASGNPAMAEKLLALFHQCLAIRDNSPYLNVESKDEKKKKAEAAA